MSASKRILVIPHGNDRNLKIREHELAVALATLPDVEVYYLEQQLPEKFTLLAKVTFLLSHFWGQPQFKNDGNYIRVSTPYLFVPFTRWTAGISRLWLNYQLKRLVNIVKPTTILNSAYTGISFPKSPDYKLIFDLIDDHLPGTHGGWFGNAIARYSVEQMDKADEIWTISQVLTKRLGELGYNHVRYVSNGVALADFNHTKETALHKLRKQYDLEGKKVIGFIGNHSAWSGMDLLVDIAKQAPSDWHFLIVGGGSQVEELQGQHPANMTLTGPVDRSQISTFFEVLDLGLLTFAKIPYTDNCLPLKILEYGAAHKPVVAEKLTELSQLQLPWVNFPTERTATAWVTAIGQALKTPWQASWNERVGEFDWQTIVGKEKDQLR
jgi:glycosyltransferase involved in cell wall biosynthesis